MRLAFVLNLLFLLLVLAFPLMRKAKMTAFAASLENSLGMGEGSVKPTLGPIAWFEKIRPHCQQDQVLSEIRKKPPPYGRDGSAYLAACLALAGKTSNADKVLQSLSEVDREHASELLFHVSHLEAEKADTARTGKMMRLILKYQPQNEKALFHAGISESLEGRKALAKKHLSLFLGIHHEEDELAWRAQRVLRELR